MLKKQSTDTVRLLTIDKHFLSFKKEKKMALLLA